MRILGRGASGAAWAGEANSAAQEAQMKAWMMEVFLMMMRNIRFQGFFYRVAF
jgi:hypothetical protein